MIEQGFKNITILNSWKKEKLDDDLEVTIIKNSELMLEDSAMLIKSKEGTVFCQTDCGMSYESLRRVANEKPDLGFFKFGAANWFPIVYDYEKERKDKISKKRKLSKLTGFVNYVKAVKPKYAIPYAGPPIFLHESLIHVNDPETGMFATPDEALNAWNEEGIDSTQVKIMSPSDEITVEGNITKNNEPVFSNNKMEIIQKLSEEVKDDL